LQNRGAALYVTFTTHKRWILPEAARAIVMSHLLHDHGARYELHAAVVMPDHVHVLLTPRRDAEGNTFGLAEIMQGIKGSSAHSINRLLARKGAVWQPESWDTSLRRDEKRREKADYICANPVRAGLVDHQDDWPWIWREWVEGVEPGITDTSAESPRRRGRLRSISPPAP
jgi:putative DNA methylase